jgi:hypothetical protein
LTAGEDRGTSVAAGVGSRHLNQMVVVPGVLLLLSNSSATLELPIPVP